MKKTHFNSPQILGLFLMMATLFFAGCKKDKKDDPDDVQKVLVIDNGAMNIKPDESPTYTAKFVLADGSVEAASNVTWSTSNSSVATISSAGVVSAVAVGSVTLEASVTESGVTYRASVPLGIQGATMFAVAPSAIIMVPGESLQMETFYFGTSTPTYTFSSSNTAVATVSATGQVNFVAVGSCVISVEASSYPGAPFNVPVLVVAAPTVKLPVTRVEVTPGAADLFRGESVQFSAQAYDLDGPRAATFLWVSSDPTIATVNSSGQVTGQGIGSTFIHATAEGISAQAEVVVHPDTVIEIKPYIASVTAGGTRQFSAKAYNARNGMALLPAITNFDWFIPSYGIPMFDFATVNQSGLVSVNSGAMVGNMTFVAATLPSNPEIGSAAIVMVSLCDCGPGNAAVESINIANGSSASISLFGNPQLQLNATGHDINGNAVSNPALKFCSDSPAVVSVDPDTGLIIAAGPGTATVTVCSGPYAEASIAVTVSF